MPLFMDIHEASDYEAKSFVEQVKRNHIADLKVQDKYGVRYIQYWINAEKGLVFCLMEGPDKGACTAVHREAHGDMPSNVIELTGGDYVRFMGEEGTVNEFDIVEKPDGTLDTGYRVLEAIDMISGTDVISNYRTIHKIFENFKGREVSQAGDRIMAAFDSSIKAIDCAYAILNLFEKKKTTEIRIGISAGAPVAEEDEIFSYTIKLASRLCDIAREGQVLTSALVKDLCGSSFGNYSREKTLRILRPQEEKFLSRLLDTLEEMMSDSDFNVETICKNIGMSRAQLYRKVTSLTGHSPNNFLKEIRLKKALRLIEQKYGNISEIAFEVGFSNPSYFSHTFQKRFGLLPSKFLKHHLQD